LRAKAYSYAWCIRADCHENQITGSEANEIIFLNSTMAAALTRYWPACFVSSAPMTWFADIINDVIEGAFKALLRRF
jgi:hypothetical protein